MEFTGFPEETFDFYRALGKDNTNEFWRRAKPGYLLYCWDQMQLLLDSLADFGPGRPLSPHRDRRSQGGRPPFKEYQGGRVERVPNIWFYVDVSLDGMTVAAGLRTAPTPDQVARLRAAIDAAAPGGELTRIVTGLSGAGFELAGETVKTAPRGYSAEHPRIDLLRHRTLSCQTRWPEGPWLRTPAVRERTHEAWTQLRPLVAWLEEHVGAPR